MKSLVGGGVSPRRVERLALRGFRNLSDLEVEPGSQFNVIYGDNGAGKSNFLESIEYLGSLKSFRSAKKTDLIRLGCEEAQIHAKIGGDLASRVFRVHLYETRGRRLSIDDKRPRSIGQWREAIQTVIFHPGHLQLTAGGPEGRRAYMDDVLCKIDAAYDMSLAEYQKAVRSRNRLLKRDEVDRRSVRAFDEILATRGELIGQARARLIEELSPWVLHAFTQMVGHEFPMSLSYRPRVEPKAEVIRSQLDRAFSKDRARGFTADGPHADDLDLRVRDVKARHHASQGQHRMAALSLKIAELHFLTAATRAVPILLLDDVSSELDRGRNRKLFELLTSLGGQVFLTTTHPEFILLDGGRVDFQVKGGLVEASGPRQSCANPISSLRV